MSVATDSDQGAGTILDSVPMRFRIRFGVQSSTAASFVRMLETGYVPALRDQPGFVSAHILTPFTLALSAEIGATTTPDVYELEFDFVSEQHRRDWVAQPVHDVLWNRAVELSTTQEWSGFFIEGCSAESNARKES